MMCSIAIATFQVVISVPANEVSERARVAGTEGWD
jgi:hypothetical protein